MFESITPSELDVGLYFDPDGLHKAFMRLGTTIHTRERVSKWIASHCISDDPRDTVPDDCVVCTELFDVSDITKYFELERDGTPLWMSLAEHEVILDGILAKNPGRFVPKRFYTNGSIDDTNGIIDDTNGSIGAFQFIEYSINVPTLTSDARHGFVTAINIDDAEFKIALINSIERVRDPHWTAPDAVLPTSVAAADVAAAIEGAVSAWRNGEAMGMGNWLEDIRVREDIEHYLSKGLPLMDIMTEFVTNCV